MRTVIFCIHVQTLTVDRIVPENPQSSSLNLCFCAVLRFPKDYRYTLYYDKVYAEIDSHN